ncbi:MAG: hypothetical protein K6F71_06245 [Ruminococcus sp.]|uniref:hypothetical protein n=1 Tax=Ruminococcus sp. TaxID=41978 RepID=UPI0025E25A19|nr:hypothetical protein [Ruminococcus sp.]MCR5540406.1 hypothetical protein [Ruminococcus sp.]
MKKHLSAVIATALVLSLSACGTLAPPQRAEMTSTTTTTAETTTAPVEISEPAVSTKPEISEKEKKELENNVFMTEFFNSPITFIDKSDIADQVLKNCSFEHIEQIGNGMDRISLRSESGSGIIDVTCIDMTTSDLDCDLGNMIDSIGDYYYGLTRSSMKGVSNNDFNTNFRMTNTVVSKGKYQQYGLMQRSDGMATQFGYAETYATLVNNKLTVVSGQFVSTDMMDRQAFTRLMTSFREKIPF